MNFSNTKVLVDFCRYMRYIKIYFNENVANSNTGAGKSNGYRLIYYVVKDDKEIYLLTIYYKKDNKEIPSNFDIALIIKRYCIEG